MCDNDESLLSTSQKQLNSNIENMNEIAESGIHQRQLAPDAISLNSSESSFDQQLHQTTQSLAIASSIMMAGFGAYDSNSIGVGDGGSSSSSSSNGAVINIGGNINSAGAIAVGSSAACPTNSGGISNSIVRYNDLNIFGSSESMVGVMTTPTVTTQPALAPQIAAAVNTVKINVEELLRENRALREKLKEVTVQRDQLLCEVSNLRLELDMSELKQLPERSFPQKSIERSGSTQYDIAAPPGSTTSGGNTMSTMDCGGGGYVYLQQHYIPSSSSSAAINYPIMPQSHMIYQQQQQQQQQQHHHHPQQYANSCHQQQQQTITGTGVGIHHGQHVNLHHQHQHHHHHLLHGHHHHHGGAVVIAGSGVGTGIGGCGVVGLTGGGPGCTSPSAMQQNMHKKNTIRNGSDVMKRARAQTAYELSQDLLEKQIELLERKYGGVRARNAAITIQRAFRHYMMVKKFASITAMAKAEKRLSRRVVIVSGGSGGVGGSGVTGMEDGPASNSSLSSAYGSATESQLEMIQQQQQQPRVTILAGPPGSVCSGSGSMPIVASNAMSSRTPPSRSLSMRERRQQDGSPIPRSQSGASSVPIGGCGGSSASSTSSGTLGSTGSTAHPHVNLLHATEPHFYSSQHLATHYYHVPQHDISYASSANNSHLDSSLNTSWASVASVPSGISPHTPYYSAAQIYMRPKGTPDTRSNSSSNTTSAERKKVPPEVPKRTSSIAAQQHAQHLAAQQHQHMLMMRQTPPPPSLLRSNGLCKSAENGSLTSVQSSGSDSSVTSADRLAVNSDIGSDRSNSPQTWKRNTALTSSQQFVHNTDVATVTFGLAQATAATGIVSGSVGSAGNGVAPNTSDDHAISSHTTAAQYEQHDQQQDHHLNATAPLQNYKVSETIRKRQYRVGLNLFNKKPEKGITYLIRRGFLENTPQGVARFLISRKGLSRQMIGEYLGNLQNQFNMAVLSCFALELDLSGMQVDVALRKFQAYFRMPGEAQKIERLMEIFSQRFCQCNQDIVGRLRSSDTIFVLAFAIIMLNTDLHTPNMKPERRMRVEDFIKNLRGIDDCHDIDKDMLAGIYERVKANEFKPGSDHVTQVMKVQATIVGKKPNLALPHRRLVCYCRLYEIPDVNKKERPGVHQREVFLFNDLLVITKIFSKKKSSVTYTFRNSFPLCGMVVSLLDVSNYPFCIQLSQKVDGKILITFNARNEHDRCKFAEDLKESISEMDEMEALRIEAELERQKSARNRTAGSSENRDSGVADVEVGTYQSTQAGELAPNANSDAAQQLKRSALSNSLLDMHEQFGNEKPQRRGSVGSLDSGMSISFQSTTTSSASRENAAVIAAAANAAAAKMRYNIPTGVASTAAAAAGVPVPMVGGGGNAVNAATVVYPNVVGTYAHAAAGFVSQPHAILMHQQMAMQQQQQQQQQQQHLQHMQQQQQQLQAQQHAHAMQSSITGRVPGGSGRERKLSRSDESGRSTEV